MPTETVPRWRSLRAKLALFLLLFSIPALIMVEFAVLSFEYFEVISRFNRGALQHQAQLLARELYPHLDQPPEELRLRLNNARLQLQDPRSTWLGEPFVLSELSDQPIRITLRRADGSLWIAALVAPAVPEPGARIWRGESGIEGATEFVRIEIALSAPWRRVESAFSFEWPVMVACLSLVGLGAGVFLHRVVLRRLERIAAAAEGWSRERFALFGRASKRFEKATIRGDERLYIDSWGQMASTTDARYYYDLNDNLRLGGHVRFNVQSPVSFWKRAYTAELLPTGAWNIPQFRTADRELGPLIGVTAGANFRVAFAQVLSLNLQAEGLYNQYLDHIYVFNRLGLFTAATLELEID